MICPSSRKELAWLCVHTAVYTSSTSDSSTLTNKPNLERSLMRSSHTVRIDPRMDSSPEYWPMRRLAPTAKTCELDASTSCFIVCCYAVEFGATSCSVNSSLSFCLCPHMPIAS